MTFTGQEQFDLRFECGEQGLRALSTGRPSHCVIVDVLSFSTCVDVAVGRGAQIIPYFWKDDRAAQFAREHDAELAGGPEAPFALTVESLLRATAQTRLVLPSPNGSTLSFMAAEHAGVLCGCLRNRSAICRYLNQQPGPVAVIAAGERWRTDDSLRPCFEDVVGAGAILAGLRGTRSPEAESAIAAFEAVRDRLRETLFRCSSGRELDLRGHRLNVELAAELDASTCVPLLQDGCFVRADASS